MQLEEFYNTVSSEKNNSEIFITVQFNPKHPIYKGHFPNQPVVPGIMQIETLTSLINSELELNHELHKVSNVKYLNMIVPSSELISFDIKFKHLENNMLKINCIIKNETVTYTKFSGVFKPKQNSQTQN